MDVTAILLTSLISSGALIYLIDKYVDNDKQ
jgi:hypothetical protein|nr:MAG TPA: hypothetical protein [Caudoviricetes sp.]